MWADGRSASTRGVPGPGRVWSMHMTDGPRSVPTHSEVDAALQIVRRWLSPVCERAAFKRAHRELVEHELEVVDKTNEASGPRAGRDAIRASPGLVLSMLIGSPSELQDPLTRPVGGDDEEQEPDRETVAALCLWLEVGPRDLEPSESALTKTLSNSEAHQPHERMVEVWVSDLGRRLLSQGHTHTWKLSTEFKNERGIPPDRLRKAADRQQISSWKFRGILVYLEEEVRQRWPEDFRAD